MQKKFTVFTPTYNREKLIGRVFESLKKQSFKDFEWLIIDDGSSDNTESIIDQYKKSSPFPITYIKRENKGKACSINEALDIAKGELFLVFDSDDWCKENALAEFSKEWDNLSYISRSEFCGISCLKEYTNGKIVGETYERLSKYDNTYVDRLNLKIKGDKWECLVTEHHKCNKYEIDHFERYQAPEFSWLKMGKKYKTIFLDKSLSIIEYQEDGISRNNILHRSNSPRSTMKYYELAELVSNSMINKFKSRVNFVRFAIHANEKSKMIFKGWLAILPGIALYFLDKYKLNKYSK